MLMVGGQVPVLPPPRIPRLPMPPRLHPPGSHTITKFRYRRTKYPTYLVIVLRLLQELVERDLLTHGGRWSVSCLCSGRREVMSEQRRLRFPTFAPGSPFPPLGLEGPGNPFFRTTSRYRYRHIEI